MSSRKRPLRRVRPQLELLEDRRLLSMLFHETAGDDGPNELLLQIEGNKLVLRDNGAIADEAVLNAQLTDVVIIGADGEADRLTINYGPGFFSVAVSFTGGAGDGDAIVLAANVDFTLTDASLTTSQGGSPVGSEVTLVDGLEQATLTGGGSNNTLDASGFSGSTTLNGGGGNDTLTGGAGNDNLLGGAGDDRLVSTAGGDDNVEGGLGNDTYVLDPGSTITALDDGGNDVIDLSAITSGGVDVTLAGSDGTIFEKSSPSSIINVTGSIETLIATNDADDLKTTNTTLSALVQVFIGGAGDDLFTDESTAAALTFNGGTASGLPVSGGGNDTYKLNPGSVVTVINDGGNDTIDLGTVTTGGATVTLGETDGSVTVPGGSVVITGAIKDVFGTPFDDSITGNSLDNLLDGKDGNDTIVGGDGNNELLGDLGDDSITGGPGDDTLDGGGGNDTLDGGGGKDIYKVIPGSTDVLNDSGGIDWLDFSGASLAISINLAASGTQVIDTAGNKIKLVGTFENVIGTAGNDVINGNSANNILVGGAGDDQLSGHSGRDILIGGAGRDRLIGGPDDDILIGGIVSFDSNLSTISATDVAALTAIQAEWTSSRSYAKRVKNLRGTPDSPTDPDWLNRLNGNFFLKVSGTGQTVFDDSGAADTLTGSQQDDWFFLFTGDTATDRVQAREFVDP